MAKAQLKESRIFVILDDKATVLNLKKGSTALDAAFAIHSDLGLSTSSIVVNGKTARLDQPLENGDIITVQVNKNKKVYPRLFWLNIVQTDSAKAILRKFFRKETSLKKQVLDDYLLKLEYKSTSASAKEF